MNLKQVKKRTQTITMELKKSKSKQYSNCIWWYSSGQSVVLTLADYHENWLISSIDTHSYQIMNLNELNWRVKM